MKEITQDIIEGNKLKWEKIERGYHGNGQKWKYGEKIFSANRSSYVIGKWYFYELPNNKDGDQIFTGSGDFRSVLKKFKEWYTTHNPKPPIK